MLISHQQFIRADGRSLDFYASKPRSYELYEGLQKPAQASRHLRWHPLRQEWVAYADARQDRTFLPASALCPLCPMAHAQAQPTEIPTPDFEVAIFSNRFAAFDADDGSSLWQHPSITSKAAVGSCQVVCYGPEHNRTLAQLSTERRRLLVEAIAHKSEQLYSDSAVELVLPFENVGKEIGVTLEHPHGQIYALNIVPPMLQRQAQAMAQQVLPQLLRDTPAELVLTTGAYASLIVPYCARYPYEMWLVPHSSHDHLARAPELQRRELADLLGTALNKLSALFPSPPLYTLAWHFAPRSYFGNYHYYLAIQPLRRAANKLKFLAGVEQSSGLFLADITPERAAAALREL